MDRTGAFEILFFFICLNLGCYLIQEFNFLGYSIQAVETPASIEETFLTNLGGSIAIIMGGTIAGLLLNAIAQGAIIALVIAAINMLFPVFNWVVAGFPNLLEAMGVPEPIPLILKVVVGIVWVWFLIGIVAQRYME